VTPVSVVIPVRDDAAALARTLDHLVARPGAVDLDVVVAAAGDAEATRRVTEGRGDSSCPAPRRGRG
jgi:hypothetical protein